MLYLPMMLPLRLVHMNTPLPFSVTKYVMYTINGPFTMTTYIKAT